METIALGREPEPLVRLREPEDALVKSVEQVLLAVRRIVIEERLDRVTSCQQSTLEVVFEVETAGRSPDDETVDHELYIRPVAPLEYPDQGPDQRIQMPVEVGRLDPVGLADACQPRGPDLVPMRSEDLGKTQVAGGPQAIG